MNALPLFNLSTPRPLCSCGARLEYDEEILAGVCFFCLADLGMQGREIPEPSDETVKLKESGNVRSRHFCRGCHA